MYGAMKSHRAEYDVQPAYNESLLPVCPPNYSEAVALSTQGTPSTYQLPYPKQPVSQAPKAPKEPQAFQAPQVPQAFPAPQVQLVTYPGVMQPQPMLPVAVGPKRCVLKCPHCLAIVRTETSTGVKRSAHYCCCLLFFCGCFLCSCIPYCLASFKDVHHTCPQCKGFVGTYRA